MVPITPPPNPYGGNSFGAPSSGYAPPPQSGYGSFDPYATTPNTSGGYGNGGALFGGGTSLGGPTVTPIGPPTPVSPGTFNPAPTFSSTPSFGDSGGLFGGIFGSPASSPSFNAPLNAPIINAPAYGGGYDNPSVYGTPTYSDPSFGSSGTMFPNGAFPSSSPSTLFPDGMFSGGLFPGGADNQFSAYRLLQGPRIRHGYVGFGDSDDDLNINDTDVSAILAFPNFFYSNQPLYVVPSFSLHLWDGPDGSAPTSNITADLPGSAYSAFLDLGWNSDPNQMFSTEFGVRVGAFTDFDTFNSDSLRVLGKGLASFRLTPASTLKAGVYYLDRNKVKLLPAGGLLYQPNPYTRMDIFFPEPKLARYWRTVGTNDVWWYLAGDYGGGSWTIERDNGSSDSIDINDLRVTLGLEWGQSDAIRAGRRNGFLEVGYVFDREVEYRRNPNDNFKPDDGIVFRAGLGY
ncbi:hypothetical protein [Rubripirellula amarantea]|nr:hypothetical protein [Rubripirellula amarantea]